MDTFAQKYIFTINQLPLIGTFWTLQHCIEKLTPQWNVKIICTETCSISTGLCTDNLKISGVHWVYYMVTSHLSKLKYLYRTLRQYKNTNIAVNMPLSKYYAVKQMVQSQIKNFWFFFVLAYIIILF